MQWIASEIRRQTNKTEAPMMTNNVHNGVVDEALDGLIVALRVVGSALCTFVGSAVYTIVGLAVGSVARECLRK